ncbi:hypothetical protein BHYA_0271g00030 [Botrytis hyacinthi]|uniref:Uncharacterized protein n=1 Tax=Botrytis hyacinthi TaxID=278943 RepID=A0A4Z1GGE6_9HELO|nr:hypothetical protein BHYA_0271g00030 [Botrytis hyacinthi]
MQRGRRPACSVELSDEGSKTVNHTPFKQPDHNTDRVTKHRKQNYEEETNDEFLERKRKLRVKRHFPSALMIVIALVTLVIAIAVWKQEAPKCVCKIDRTRDG